MLVSRRPESSQPTTSEVEWDAKGPRAARALIALLGSSFGRGVSGMARFWAGRIAVTQHINGPSAHERRTPRSRQVARSGGAGRGFRWAGPLGNPLPRLPAL